jgi:hypothetical protein
MTEGVLVATTLRPLRRVSHIGRAGLLKAPIVEDIRYVLSATTIFMEVNHKSRVHLAIKICNTMVRFHGRCVNADLA